MGGRECREERRKAMSWAVRCEKYRDDCATEIAADRRYDTLNTRRVSSHLEYGIYNCTNRTVQPDQTIKFNIAHG
jgi:hypothetical protein